MGIAVHAAIGTRPVPGLADVTAAVMKASYGLRTDRARELAIAGTPAQVTGQRCTSKQERRWWDAAPDAS